MIALVLGFRESNRDFLFFGDCLMFISILLTLEFQVAHPILNTISATDQKWPLCKSFSYLLPKPRNQLTKNGHIFSKKVPERLKFSKKFDNKKCAPRIKLFNENYFRKIQIIFDIENRLWKSEIGILCQLISGFW